jgi:hypothetical protein
MAWKQDDLSRFVLSPEIRALLARIECQAKTWQAFAKKVGDQISPHKLSEETKREYSEIIAQRIPKTPSILAEILARLPPAASAPEPAPPSPTPAPEPVKTLKKTWLNETMARVKQIPGEPNTVYAQRLFEEPGCPYKSAASIEPRLYGK